MPPTMLLGTLQQLRRKVKLLSFVYGLGIVLAAAAGLLLGAVGLDYALNLPGVPRLIVLLAALGALGYLLFAHVVTPALAKLTLSDVAGRLERAFPQFDDRLRSTVAFLDHDVPGSEFMKQQVVSQAAELAGRVDLNRAILAAPAWYSMAGGIGAVVLLMLLATFAVSDQFVDIAASRLLNPFGDARWPKRVQIALSGDVPQRVPVGQRVDVKMKLSRGDSAGMKAIVYYQYDDGPVQQEFMTRGEDGTYAASLDARIDPSKAAGAMKVWMKSGDDEATLPQITVVPRLAIRSVQASLTPPPYVGRRTPTTVDLTAAPAVMAVGSDVSLAIGFNKPLAADGQVELEPVEPNAKLPSIRWQPQGEAGVVGTFPATDSVRFRLRAVDTDGFRNNALEEYELIVRPDQSPSVQIENPRRSEERTAESVIPLQGVADDDYGIRSLTLVVQRVGDKQKWEIPLVADTEPAPGVSWQRIDGTGDRQRYRAGYQWELAKLEDAGLKSGDVLEYHLLAADAFDLNGQRHEPVPSGKLRVTIISQDELAARVIDELRQVKGQVGEAQKAQLRTREETAQLAEDVQGKEQLDRADKAAAERLTNQQATVSSQTRTLAGKVEQIRQRLEENRSPSQELKDTARDVAGDLTRAAEQPMKSATTDLTSAAQDQKPEQRDRSLEQAQANQQRAAEQLEQALGRMENIGSLQQAIAQLGQLLAEQQDVTRRTAQAGRDNLGKRPEDMSPEDRQKLDAAAADQQKLAEKTAKALENLKAMADQMRKGEPASAEAMDRAASTAKQQQVSPNQQKAANAAKQNQQSQAQSAQKQVELGLEMALNDLREAERRKLAELQKKLDELQKQVANLVRRQANHNLDNLASQGAERLAKLPADELSALNAKAEREQGIEPPAPQPHQLTSSQEQTERNTRDIARVAAAMTNGAEPAAHLTRAAGRMERAIFALRDRKFADAYEPPQVEALAALEAAKKSVDQQKDRVDEEIAEQEREAIRQKFVKLKEDQEKLNAETARIDAAKGPDGWNRIDRVRLGQLPGEQGKLAERVTAIDQDLAAVGSVVYVWANKDIAGAMERVKTALGKPETGKPTQENQARIVEQLDAMIKNLQTKPKDSKFAQDAGGGGGGGQGGAQPLPTEAELRLLKALQEIVNRDTREQDRKDAPVDPPRVVAIGERQGELRTLLDTLIQNASRGELKLDPEPDLSKPLPEEQGGNVADAELDQHLLEGNPEAEQEERDAHRIGDRMARSRQRLAVKHDPGPLTQLIQKKILENLDDLIEQARQQQAETRNSPPQPSQAQSRPDQQQQAAAQNQGQQQQGTQAAQQSSAGNGGGADADLNKDLRETMAEWGAITPRLREAQREGQDEMPVESYRRLIEEYFKSLSTKRDEQ